MSLLTLSSTICKTELNVNNIQLGYWYVCFYGELLVSNSLLE